MNKYLIILVLFIGVGYAGYYYGKESVEPKIQLQETIKIEKQVETVIETITLPSGEVRTITKIVEVQKTEAKTEIKPTTPKKNWGILLGRGQKKSDIIVGMDYRVVGDLSIGITAVVQNLETATPYITLRYTF